MTQTTVNAEVVVAGHICLDVIPAVSSEEALRFRPGALSEIGPATVALGGCVSNTGQALHRLGAATRLLAKVGDDAFGRLVADTLARVDLHLAEDLVVAPGEHTSYSLILSPPDRDRMVLHYPGANDTFSAEDIEPAVLEGARLLHLGYPPLMRRMYEGDGENLAQVLRRAKDAGLTTALDLAYPDPTTPAGHADWRRILSTALPLVDICVPSVTEVMIMLEPDVWKVRGGTAGLIQVSAEDVSRLGDQLIALGATIVAIKIGDRGLYLRTASPQRLAGMELLADAASWTERELWSGVFEVDMRGTTGAGDATAAGLLFGLLRGMSPEDAITAACATGASSVEAPDATSGVRSWAETQNRINASWKRRDPVLGPAWTPSARQGLWHGPRDSS